MLSWASQRHQVGGMHKPGPQVVEVQCGGQTLWAGAPATELQAEVPHEGTLGGSEPSAEGVAGEWTEGLGVTRGAGFQ